MWVFATNLCPSAAGFLARRWILVRVGRRSAHLFVPDIGARARFADNPGLHDTVGLIVVVAVGA